jgi:hypothetical protein
LFDFVELWPIQPFSLSLGRNDAVLVRALVVLRDYLLAVVNLIFQADLFLACASADASYDPYNKRVPIPGLN